MTIIQASSVGMKTMADGTLRLTVDIEPTSAQEAFRLFGAPGTSLALAALKDGHAKKSDEPGAAAPAPEPPKKRRAPTAKPIAQWLALRCAEPGFQAWLEVASEEEAAAACRSLCGVESRGDIDGSPEHEDWFRRHIQQPWKEHCDGE